MKWLNGYKIRLVLLGVGLVVMLTGGKANAGSGAIEITVLYDNYTLTEGCTTDWGFACIIEGTEKCILFDTGANGSILLGNMDKLQVSAGDVELVVISHNHADHTGGLLSFLGRNNNVAAYLPLTVSSGFVQNVRSRGATAQLPTDTVQICEGAHVAVVGQIEQFLVLETPKGLVVITGCAHPGIVQIVQKAKEMLEKDVYFVIGGFHLLNDSDSQVRSKIGQFRSMGVQKVGASHCTGDRAIALFEQEYGNDFVPIGVGQLTIPVEYDLNGDGIVDSADMGIMVDHWQTKEPSCDIAPGLFGDGIVDVQDLIVLAEHLFEDVNDPTLVAHWALDEAEGDIAYDGANGNNGSVHGDPSWQPEGGMVEGALQLDGIDDYVSTPFVLNPADGKFSVFAWIKGGGAGQVVIAQENGLNWLRADTLEGNLMTELKAAGRGGAELLSQTVITDGNWHRIGFVWDGSNRTLYVDDVAVADEDAQTNLAASENGLYIGAGKAMEPGSFWFGLIDDVRIYSRAIIP